jgi:hypothetical protein
MASERGLAPRALRDIEAAAKVGRFTTDDPELALAIAAGALMGMGALIRDQPDRDDAATADKATEDLLRLLGVPAEEAREICQRPLPDLDALIHPDSAA